MLYLHESTPRLLQPTRSNSTLFISFFERRKYRVLFSLWMHLAFREEHPELFFSSWSVISFFSDEMHSKLLFLHGSMEFFFPRRASTLLLVDPAVPFFRRQEIDVMDGRYFSRNAYIDVFHQFVSPFFFFTFAFITALYACQLFTT